MAPPRDLDAALDTLEAALQGRDEQRLIVLLGVWGHHRSASVAEAIDELSPVHRSKGSSRGGSADRGDTFSSITIESHDHADLADGGQNENA